MLENKPHAELKRTLTSAFSGSSIVSLEPLVDPVIVRWAEQTKNIYVGTGRVCDMGLWMQFFAFDVVTNLTYSKTHGFVDRHEDVDGIVGWLGWMFSYTSAVGASSHLSFILYLLLISSPSPGRPDPFPRPVAQQKPHPTLPRMVGSQQALLPHCRLCQKPDS